MSCRPGPMENRHRTGSARHDEDQAFFAAEFHCHRGEAAMADDFGYHIDHHGSLVRPAALLAARASLSGKALAAAQDEAVIALAHSLRRLTLSACCDGQYRRSY